MEGPRKKVRLGKTDSTVVHNEYVPNALVDYYFGYVNCDCTLHRIWHRFTTSRTTRPVFN